jgi:NCAIR mutase (PurE)-related protein
MDVPMDKDFLARLLTSVQAGDTTITDALETLKHFPAEPLAEACVDHQRSIRTGIPEVIYGESKTAEQITAIGQAMLQQTNPLIATRIDEVKADKVRQVLPELIYHQQARMLTGRTTELAEDQVRGTVLVICAGTSDIPVAEEARVTAQALGHPVAKLYDAGVAGLHRLLSQKELFSTASVIIVAAGMEGALPSVVGGLVACPVIGVPTSVGYGAGIGGFAALLGMLNSCSPGVAVVNIDNGFGAGCMAAAINRAS